MMLLPALSIAEYNYNNTRIYAPLSGVVANLEAKQWNPCQNYKNLCTIIFDEVMEVEFPVIESEYSFINKGMPVGIVPFINDSTLISGRITEINPQVDENGMVKVKAQFQNNGRLIDGMNVKIVIRKPVLKPSCGTERGTCNPPGQRCDLRSPGLSGNMEICHS